MTPAEFVAWVEASCERHRVPIKVTDTHTISQVAVLLTGKNRDGLAAA